MFLIRFTLLLVATLLAASPAVAETDCRDAREASLFSPEQCKALRVSREALQLNRQLLEKSEAIRQSISRQLEQQRRELNDPKPRP